MASQAVEAPLNRSEAGVGDNWHEYFEDFPAEDPANYWSNGKFELGAARRERELLAQQAADQAALDNEIARMIAEGKQRAADRNDGAK